METENKNNQGAEGESNGSPQGKTIYDMFSPGRSGGSTFGNESGKESNSGDNGEGDGSGEGNGENKNFLQQTGFINNDIGKDPFGRDGSGESDNKGDGNEGGEGDGSGSGEEGNKGGEVIFDVTSFNKEFNTTFENKDSISAALQSVAKVKELEEQISQQSSRIKTFDEKAKSYDDVLNFFSPEKLNDLVGYQDYKSFEDLKKKFPDRDPSLLSFVRSDAFTQLPTLQKLLVGEKLRVRSNVSDDVRQEKLLKRLGIESEVSALTPTDQYAIDAALVDYQKDFDEIRNFKAEPLTFDIKTEIGKRENEVKVRVDKLTNDWKSVVPKLISNYKETKAFIKDDKGNSVEIFKFAVDDGFRNEWADKLVSVLVSNNLDVTEENIRTAANYLDDQFWRVNRDKIANQAIEHGKTLAEKKNHEENNNDGEQKRLERSSKEVHGFTLKEMAEKKAAKTA